MADQMCVCVCVLLYVCVHIFDLKCIMFFLGPNIFKVDDENLTKTKRKFLFLIFPYIFTSPPLRHCKIHLAFTTVWEKSR